MQVSGVALASADWRSVGRSAQAARAYMHEIECVQRLHCWIVGFDLSSRTGTHEHLHCVFVRRETAAD